MSEESDYRRQSTHEEKCQGHGRVKRLDKKTGTQNQVKGNSSSPVLDIIGTRRSKEGEVYSRSGVVTAHLDVHFYVGESGSVQVTTPSGPVGGARRD